MSTTTPTAGIVGHWIAVGDAMPDDEITCLVWSRLHDDAVLAHHDSDLLAEHGDSGWIHRETGQRLLVTHWCADLHAPTDH